MRVSIIAAVAENGVIGRGGKLPWHLADDLKSFKRLTLGHTIIMGRRTWESIGRPLPGRRMIVVSRRPAYHVDIVGVLTAESLIAAMALVVDSTDDEAFVIGGAEMYREALPLADRLYLTRVRAHVDGDTLFPAYDSGQWRQISTEHHAADAQNEYPYSFEVFEQKSSK